jgi:hypothetical protein
MSARIPPANAPYPSSVQKILDGLTIPGTEPLSLFRTLARDERLFARFTGGGLLDPGHLTLREREIVIHRVCALNGADKAGLDATQLAATLAPGVADCWSPREALLIDVCDAVNARADIDDVLWARLSDAFEEPARIELMMLTGFYRTVSLLVNGLRLEPEPFAAPFPET